MMKKYILFFALALGCMAANAQSATSGRLMLGLHAGYGISSLKYDEVNMGTGIIADADLSLFLTSYVGVSVGLGYSMYKSDVELNDTYTQNITVPVANAEAISGKYTVELEKWKEEQKAASIDIPVKLVFRLPFGDDRGLYIGAGVKYCMMRSGEYEVTDGNIAAKCELDDINLKFPSSEQELLHHNVGTMSMRPSGSIKLKSGIAACADAGFVQGTGAFRIYYGVTASYGLTGVVDKKGSAVMDFNGGYTNVTRSSKVDKVVPIVLGAKIGIRLAM